MGRFWATRFGIFLNKLTGGNPPTLGGFPPAPIFLNWFIWSNWSIGLNIGVANGIPRLGNWAIGNKFIWYYGFCPGWTNTVFYFLEVSFSESAFLDFLLFFFFLRPEMSLTDFSALTSFFCSLLLFLAVIATDASLSTRGSSSCSTLAVLLLTSGGTGTSSGTYSFFFFSAALGFFEPFFGYLSFFSLSRQAFYLQKKGLSEFINYSNSSYRREMLENLLRN